MTWHGGINLVNANRQQRVLVGNSYSDLLPVLAGVPQGSVLGPILFLCFIDDIFICVTNDLNVFADDSTLSRIIASPAHRTSAAASLNTDLLALQAWASLWLVKFNDDKTELVTFSRKADVAAFRSGKPVDPSTRRRGRPRKLNSESRVKIGAQGRHAYSSIEPSPASCFLRCDSTRSNLVQDCWAHHHAQPLLD